MQHQLGSPTVSQDWWSEGHTGGVAGEKGTVGGVEGGDPEPEPEPAPEPEPEPEPELEGEELPGPVLATTM